MNSLWSLSILTFLAVVNLSTASECCLAYYNLKEDYVDAQWCDDYCCGNEILGLTCCSELALRAPDDDIADYCILWWHHHIWAPIVTGVVCLLIIGCCCFCCYRCCCAERRTIVYQNQPAMGGPNVTVVQSSMNSMQTSGGYNQPVQFENYKY